MQKTLKSGTTIRIISNKDMTRPWYLEYYIEDGSKYGKRIRQTCAINRIEDYDERMAVAYDHLERLQKDLGYKNKFIRRSMSLEDAIYTALKIKDEKTDRPKSRTTYNSIGNVFLNWLRYRTLADINIKIMDRTLAITFLDDMMRERMIGNCTYNNYINVLRSIFFELQERDIIQTNPFSNIKELKVTQPTRRAMSKHEKTMIITAIRRKRDWSLELAVLLLYYTFIRPSELRRLKFRNIDLERGIIHLPGSVTKNKESAQLTMNVALIEELRRLGIDKYRDDWFVFGQGGEPHASIRIGEHTLNNKHSKILAYLRKKHQMDMYGISLYSWKDTGAFDMLEAGISINRLKDHIRHKNLSDTQRYLKPLTGIDSRIRNANLRL